MGEDSTKARRYDIDWLRVILFGLLIPFHVAIGIYWSTYGTDVNPNIADAGDDNHKDLAQDGNDYTTESIDFNSMLLHWMHQWRLAALFMISGIGTAFAFGRRSYGEFLLERLTRLIVPMFFGMWITGFVGGLILGSIDIEGNPGNLVKAFIKHIFWTSLLFWIPLFGKIIALGHLWFLWNLFLYSLILTPIFHFSQKNPSGVIVRTIKGLFSIKYGVGILLLIPLILTVIEVLFKPWFPGFIGMGYEWPWYLGFFLFGYSCILAKEDYYHFLEQKRVTILIITLIWTLAFIWIRIKQHHDGIPYVDGGWIWEGVFHSKMTLLGCLIHSFHAWFWCLTIFSWSAHLLNRPSQTLSYLNQAVYPLYILHMPLTFFSLSIASKFGLTNYPAVVFGCLLVTTGCLILFEIIKRTAILRFLFGVKPISRKINSLDNVTSDENNTTTL